MIFVKLRKMIAAESQSTDAILGAIAVAAHSLTGATGAAVAMPRDGEVVCVGRSGESAPELGAHLNIDSGISGECLRTGVIMRCDDASRDFHVNAEVCRQLGLQSIAVVPLRGQNGRVGVLEAFSNQSYAFNEDKMDLLGRLAGLAEAAWARGAVTDAQFRATGSEEPGSTDLRSGESDSGNLQFDEPGVPATEVAARFEDPVEQAPRIAEEVPLAQVREVFATARAAVAPIQRKWLYPAVAAVALLAVALLSLYGWKAWYRASVASGARPPVDGSRQPTDSASATRIENGLSSTPDVIRPSSRPSQLLTPSAAKSAGIAHDVTRRHARSSPSDRSSANIGMESGSVPNGAEIPQLAVSTPDSSSLGKALAAAPVLPVLGVPVSHGVAGGVLVHKVQPIYPSEARRMHVEGNVVIDAMVTAQGQVDDMKLVSGHPLLAASALDAVRRWRYTPYTLNGNPIPKETRITISFIAPQ